MGSPSRQNPVPTDSIDRWSPRDWMLRTFPTSSSVTLGAPPRLNSAARRSTPTVRCEQGFRLVSSGRKSRQVDLVVRHGGGRSPPNSLLWTHRNGPATEPRRASASGSANSRLPVPKNHQRDRLSPPQWDGFALLRVTFPPIANTRRAQRRIYCIITLPISGRLSGPRCSEAERCSRSGPESSASLSKVAASGFRNAFHPINVGSRRHTRRPRLPASAIEIE